MNPNSYELYDSIIRWQSALTDEKDTESLQNFYKMTFFSKLKNIFGFADSEYDSTTDQLDSEHTPYINPFKKNPDITTDDSASAAPTIETAEETNSDLDSSMNAEVTAKMIEVLNSGLPDFIKGCIDKEAETKYVQQIFGNVLTEYTAKLKVQIEEKAKSAWQTDRMNMEQQVATQAKQAAEASSKIEELRNRIMSLDRQKATLSEKNAQFENKIATAEAEREQFQLECKSLMNKLKVSAVNEQELMAAKEENANLLQENTSLRAEMLKLRNESASATEKIRKEITAEQEKSLTEVHETIAGLQQKLADREKALSELSSLNEALEAQIQQPSKSQEIISSLQSEIKSISDEMYKLKEEHQSAKASLASYADENVRLAGEIEKKDSALNTLQTELAKLEASNAELEKARTDLSEHKDENKRLALEIEETQKELEHLHLQISGKDNEILVLQNSIAETNDFAEQLKGAIDSNKETFKAEKEKYKQEIERLLQQNKDLTKQLENLKGQNPINVLFSDDTHRPETERQPRKEKTKKQKQVISAIDYTTDYSDWLMPTPPSETIPIIPEEETTHLKDTKPAGGGPAQMELF